MQNIQYCSSCNKTFTDSSISFCPFDGTALVEMQPVQNHREDQQFKIQQSGATPHLRKAVEQGGSLQKSSQPFSNNSSFIQWVSGLSREAIVLTIIVFVLGILTIVLNQPKRPSKPQPVAINSSSEKPIASTVPESTPVSGQADSIDPAIIKSRTKKGEQIYKRITAKYGLPVMFGWQAADVSLLIPIKEWNSLSKEEQINLSYYAESFVQVISDNSKPYIDKWAQYVKAIEGDNFNYDGLTPESFLVKAAGLCGTCWKITTGTVKGREFYEETTPVEGSSAKEFQKSQERATAKTNTEKDLKESMDSESSMSSAEHLAEATIALDDGYDPMNENWGKTGLASEHIKAISRNAPEYKEAQVLVKKIKQRDREIKAHQDAVVKEVMRMAAGN